MATTVAQTTPGSGGVPLIMPPTADRPGAGPSKVTLYWRSALSGAKVVPPFVASYASAVPTVKPTAPLGLATVGGDAPGPGPDGPGPEGPGPEGPGLDGAGADGSSQAKAAAHASAAARRASREKQGKVKGMSPAPSRRRSLVRTSTRRPQER